MKIQSLSVVVPAGRCINNCKFCVAQMVEEPYLDQMDGNKPFYDLYPRNFLRRLDFARDNGCNTVMLTGNAEPQQNRPFLEKFGTLNALPERLEYGAMKYSVMNMSTVLDEDCMAKADGRDECKYLILRPNRKLYSKWDDPASLIF